MAKQIGEVEDGEVCENCGCRDAVGTFDLDDVETPLCGACSAYATADGKVVPYNG